MKIMEFCKVLILLSVFWVSAGFAQPSKVLIVNSDNAVFRYETIASEFKKVLQQNAYQWTEFNLNSHADAEAELKQLIQQENPVLIYCIGTKAYSLARNVASNKKLLFSAAINWRRLDIGEGTYGVANELSSAQEISLLRYFFPTIKNIGLLYNDKFSREYVETIKKDASALGINIINQPINDAQEIGDALNELLPKIDMFWIISDPVVLSSKASVQQIFQLAQQRKKPVYAYSDVFIEQGAVLAISADLATIGRQSASLALMVDKDKVPEGTVQNPAGSTVTLNKCALDALRLNFNQDALDSVNKIVECDK
ncbi:ABC transporter substrate binding protein [Methylobacter sp.]|uniref:ABC transporter substrate-binding protein n=1 Tax=Methylobacter sp. TaxID=2051955 RepID=UPI0024878ABA|nr:ABC transporter substrate binding protein [Methylobacter sp.]MDI1276123.1 ABC transporter substrate binding protein [Methylobacter sp.]MDI1356807.1 ABC transporter substrate binding protein [Methylobacter sp.]